MSVRLIREKTSKRPQFRLYGRRQTITFTRVQQNLSRSVPVTKFLYPRHNLSSPARTTFNWYGLWNSLV